MHGFGVQPLYEGPAPKRQQGSPLDPDHSNVRSLELPASNARVHHSGGLSTLARNKLFVTFVMSTNTQREMAAPRRSTPSGMQCQGALKHLTSLAIDTCMRRGGSWSLATRNAAVRHKSIAKSAMS